MAWDVRGKTVLVSGATSGIGLEASVELARRGARVLMVGRDPARTEAAVADVAARSGARRTFNRSSAISPLRPRSAGSRRRSSPVASPSTCS